MRLALRRLLPLAVIALAFNACRFGYGPPDVGGAISAGGAGQASAIIGGAGGEGWLVSGGTDAGGTSSAGMAGADDAAGAPAESSGASGTNDAAGSSGSGGASGKSGSSGTGGTGGTGGGASNGGAGGANQTASGCAKLSVPLDDAGDKAHFVISLTAPADLSGATISMRFYVQAGAGGTIFNYVQDDGTFQFLGVPPAQRHLLGSGSAWETLSWNVGTEPDSAGTGIVKTNIKNIGIELDAQPSSAWSNPTIVYIDSVTVTSPALSFTFDAAASVYPTPTTNASGEELWLNTHPADTTATGSALSWQATCP